MAEGTDQNPQGGAGTPCTGYGVMALLNTARAKYVFLIGTVLYLLIVYNHRSVIEKTKGLSADIDELTSRHDEPLRPSRPFEPRQPRADAPDIETRKKDYDAKKVRFDEEVKKYDELMKEYQDEMTKYEEEYYERTRDCEELNRDLKVMQLSQNSWAGTRYFLKFIAVLLMLFGLMYVVFYGSDWERAAALFVVGVGILNMLQGGL
ncbi:MAG: hypothetical protein RDV41_01675 [Planctomycetota bacterium]|nr:hypothetical protein [Planctomycetota bacterium]